MGGSCCTPSENPDKTMSLLGRFKRQKEDKERIRKQLNLAKHSPQPAVDLCNCSLRCMPAEAYTIVRLMLKEVLLAHSNHLRTLADENGSYEGFSKMAGVLAMDFHCNELPFIPHEIGKLSQLQELNLSSNFIDDLPESIGRLKRLRKLTISSLSQEPVPLCMFTRCAYNRLRSLPSSMGDCIALQHLDLRHNEQLTELPSSLGRCLKLDVVLLDVHNMLNPPPETCEQGAEAIRNYLRGRPDFVDKVDDKVDTGGTLDVKSGATYILDAYYRRLSDTALCQMSKKKSASQLAAASELNILEKFSQRGKTNAELSKEQRDELMKQISLENELFTARMDDLCRQKQMDRKELVETVTLLEQTTSGLIDLILSNSRNAQLLQDCVLDNDWFHEQWRRHQSVRTSEIQRAMAAILNENVTLRQLYDTHQSYRDAAVAQALDAECDAGVAVDNALNERTRFQREMCDRLINDEEMQKAALLCLMEQRDAKTRQMSYQIELIENELVKMSALERANRAALAENYSNRLTAQRVELTELLVSLLHERDLRAKELRGQLDAMERARTVAEADFWLRRYQALLDTKPLLLSQKECLFETELVKALNAAGAADYAPNFARHNITTLDMLSQLTEADLQKMGVDNVGARKRLGDLAQHHRRTASLAGVDKKLNSTGIKSASSSSASMVQPNAPPPLTVARFEVECVVCLDRPAIRLLAPCGHVCACAECASELRECPLCRSAVSCVVDLPQCPDEDLAKAKGQ